jgi:hypothetical protein
VGRKTRQHCALVFVRGSFLKLAKYTISPSLPRPWYTPSNFPFFSAQSTTAKESRCRQVVLIQSDVRPEV